MFGTVCHFLQALFHLQNSGSKLRVGKGMGLRSKRVQNKFIFLASIFLMEHGGKDDQQRWPFMEKQVMTIENIRAAEKKLHHPPQADISNGET